ncbi:TIGR02587 family membrane protein [Niveispirillum sp. KHB5.9]|uniref:TIGR02587 family membrane protein n=1 Tax=Niveispirillum sp. KHB5.9 TaxID=3400269 RepID=UPI003A8A8C47
MPNRFDKHPNNANSQAMRDFGRAAGGALVFSLPMLMTMEMWWLGLAMDRTRLLLLFVAILPVLVLLARHIGFERTTCLSDDIIDSLIALGVAAIICATLLVLFATIKADTTPEEAAGKILVQMVPAAIGALLAKSEFAAARDEGDQEIAKRDETYGGELFLMGIGALFLGFNLAPTEEMMLISYQMSEWHALALVALSLVLMHGFVFAVGFAGGSQIAPGEPRWSAFVRFTLPGYVIALAISLFLLWVFGRTDGMGSEGVVMAMVVLGFPSAIGAAAARLIL